MKWLICGTRHKVNRDFLNNTLNDIMLVYGKPELIIHGACSGVDTMGGGEWAKSNNIPVETYPTEWHKYGKRAGPIRNHKMANAITENDLCIAIWNGEAVEQGIWYRLLLIKILKFCNLLLIIANIILNKYFIYKPKKVNIIVLFKRGEFKMANNYKRFRKEREKIFRMVIDFLEKNNAIDGKGGGLFKRRIRKFY